MNPEVDVMKKCHLVAMAVIVSVASGQGPLEWSNTGNSGYRAETALYKLHCWTPWPTIIGLQAYFPHSRLRGEFATIGGLVLELGAITSGAAPGRQGSMDNKQVCLGSHPFLGTIWYIFLAPSGTLLVEEAGPLCCPYSDNWTNSSVM